MNSMQSPVLVIVSEEDERPLATQLANLLGYSFANIVVGTGFDAADYMRSTRISPTYILLFVADRRDSTISELDALAQECMPGTYVVVAGLVNDIPFYRKLIEYGVLEYVTLPVNIPDIARTMSLAGNANKSSNCTTISFFSAAAGDGSSTVALNTAYSLAKDHNAKTIIVDMDYQFGMTAKNLDLSSPYGIKELFEHPDRGIDATLIERMVVGYNNNLDVIAAPNELRFYPDIKPEVIRDLLVSLKDRYQYIIIDLPHIWSPWISSAFNYSDRVMLIAQLWLKSVTHAARLMNVWRDTGIDTNQMQVVINRSGAKYKEGVTPRDFERVCGLPIQHYLPNDIRTVVAAENQGGTILEVGKSKLGLEIQSLAQQIKAIKNPPSDSVSAASPAKLSFNSVKLPF